jgi:uncharacterized hydrophobic protein (TIGR00271 family)
MANNDNEGLEDAEFEMEDGESRGQPEHDPVQIRINTKVEENIRNFFIFIRETTSFKDGADVEGTISNIKNSINFKGPNVWVLICSIVVASVGLNTNSTAVIIGAMLISPLMGPIRGVGLGVGTNDITLIVDSIKNFGIAVGISLLTAWIYFLVSPISELTPELEARTGPNLMDVFIAFFGGLAGIIAASRGDNSTVIPGVAIATALMPPLCTAGYGLAIGNLQFFLGASYLFLLNTLFICLSTILVVRYLKFPVRQFIDPKVQKKVTWVSYLALFLVVVPAVYLFYKKVQEAVFIENGKRFVNQVVLSDEEIRADFNISFAGDKSSIEILLKNKVVSDEIIEIWRRQAIAYNISPEFIEVIQGEDLNVKLQELKKDLEQSSVAGGYDIIQQKQRKIEALEERIAGLQTEIFNARKRQLNVTSLRRTIQLHFPEIDTFEVYSGVAAVPDKEIDSVFSVAVRYNKQVNTSKYARLNERLKRQMIIYLEDHGLLAGSRVRVFNY